MIWLVIDDVLLGAGASDDSPHTQTKQNQSSGNDPCLSFFSIYFFSLHFFTVCYLFFHSIKIWIFTLERKFLTFICINAFKMRTHTHTATRGNNQQFFVLNQPMYTLSSCHPSQEATGIKTQIVLCPDVSKITTKNTHTRVRAKLTQKQQSRRRRRRRNSLSCLLPLSHALALALIGTLTRTHCSCNQNTLTQSKT